VKGVADRAKGATATPASRLRRCELTDKLTKVEEALYQTRMTSSQDPLNYPIRLKHKLAALTGVVEGAALLLDRSVGRGLQGHREQDRRRAWQIARTDLGRSGPRSIRLVRDPECAGGPRQERRRRSRRNRKR